MISLYLLFSSIFILQILCVFTIKSFFEAFYFKLCCVVTSIEMLMHASSYNICEGNQLQKMKKSYANTYFYYVKEYLFVCDISKASFNIKEFLALLGSALSVWWSFPQILRYDNIMYKKYTWVHRVNLHVRNVLGYTIKFSIWKAGSFPLKLLLKKI